MKYNASYYNHSIFWTFISQECYECFTCFALKLRIALVTLNIYHFFVRKMGLPRCLSNLWTFLTDFRSTKMQYSVVSQQDIKLTAEMLILGYMIGVVTMPGAHYQFQFWFKSLIPIML